MGIKVKSHAGYIAFNEWNLDSMDKIYDLFNECFREACLYASKEELYVKMCENDDDVKTSTTMFVSLPVGPDEIDGLDFYIDIEKVIDDYIEDHIFDEKYSPLNIIATDMAAKFRKMADKIEQAVRTGEASAALDPIKQSIQESLNDAV